MKILSDIVSSFYHAAFYADVAHARRGIGMKFITVLTLVMVVLVTGYFMFYSGTLHKIAAGVPDAASQLPAIRVAGGVFSMDRPSPYNVPIGGAKDPAWISIDTTYKVGDLNALRAFMEKSKIIMLITANSYIAYKGNQTLEVHDFSEVKKDFSVTRNDWTKLGMFIADKGVELLIALVFFGLLIGLFVYNMLATFIGALVMMIIGFATRANLDFGAAMRLTAAARIPHNTIIAAPLMLGGGYIAGIASWLIWLGYLIFAALSSKRQTQ